LTNVNPETKRHEEEVERFLTNLGFKMNCSGKGILMKLSTKSRYGTRAIIDIAQNAGRGTTMLKDIAKRQSLSPKYLDHILSSMRRAGIIKNIRGRGRGYVLTKSASSITVKDIVEAVDGSFEPVECLANSELCDRVPTCCTREIWLKMKQAVDDVLEETTLQSILENNGLNKNQPNYFI
jgi:Rrf2 family cysteine metabolism transcriptional repressor